MKSLSIGAVLGASSREEGDDSHVGPGFALMTELITHGVMSEIPAVIINAQRGACHRAAEQNEQSDLQAAVFGGPGILAGSSIAPTNVKECYEFTLMSFQLAERYQTPVIVLTDFFLNNRVEKVKTLGVSEAQRADWNLYPDESSRADTSVTESRNPEFRPGPSRGQRGFFSTLRDWSTRKREDPITPPKSIRR